MSFRRTYHGPVASFLLHLHLEGVKPFCAIAEYFERVQVQQSGAGGGGDGVHLDVNTEVNAAKCTCKCPNKTKQSLDAVCSDFTVLG